jgi:hypothetical protein
MYQTWENFKVNFNMNLVIVWFIIYLSLSTEVLARAVFYADEIPEEYFREHRTRRFVYQKQLPPL